MKVISLLLVLVFALSCPALAAPQSIDLETMTLDELDALSSALLAETQSRRVALESGNADSVDESIVYEPGMYKVGSDIPAGIYVLITADGGGGRYYITDGTSGDSSVIENERVYHHAYVSVSDGEYLNTKIRFYPLASAPSFEAVDGVMSEGMYCVGRDLEPGEYAVRLSPDEDEGYIQIHQRVPPSDYTTIFVNGNSYVTVKDGEYVKFALCQLVLP